MIYLRKHDMAAGRMLALFIVSFGSPKVSNTISLFVKIG
jgi:hypothetical protein